MGLKEWQLRFDAHFAALSGARGDWPLFALEHGLLEGEVLQLEAAIRLSIASSIPDDQLSLPWVVYAAEFGYRYAGDSFWPEFETRTPGWRERGDRKWLRQAFISFAAKYGGAVPDSLWAKHFTNICWPITHGVLPRDLQHQLVRLLFQLRWSFTEDVFESAQTLGQFVSAAAGDGSSRLQEFVQNEVLLGQITAALLLQRDDRAPLLIPQTLLRVVNDIAKERAAGTWLKEAKSKVGKLRIRGLGSLRATTRDQGHSIQGRSHEELTALRLEADLYLRPRGTGWDAFVTFPSLSPVALLWPITREYLERARPQLNIEKAQPIARGRLLSGFEQRLREWPPAGALVLESEDAPDLVRTILAGFTFPAESVGLFRIEHDGLARRVVGRNLRSRQTYVLVSREGFIDAVHSGLRQTALSLDGVQALEVALGDVVDRDLELWLARYGLGMQRGLELRPAGFPVPRFDEQGYCEVQLGKPFFLRVTADFPIRHLTFQLDGEPQQEAILEKIESAQALFRVTGFTSGAHRLTLTAIEPDGTVIEGVLTIIARPPGLAGSESMAEGGLLVSLSPPRPSMESMWEGDVDIGIYGPSGKAVTAVAQFLGDNGSLVLAERRLTLPFPVTTQQWAHTWNRLVVSEERTREAYDRSGELRILFDAGVYGVSSITSRRDRTPLRWVLNRHERDWTVQLIADIDSARIAVTYFPFDRPNRASPLRREDAEAGTPLPAGGGMFVAHGSSEEVAFVAAPAVVVRGFTALVWAPSCDPVTHNLEGLTTQLRLVSQWQGARTGGSALAALRRLVVVDHLVAGAFGALCGPRWARLDMAFRSETAGLNALTSELGPSTVRSVLERDLTAVLQKADENDPLQLAARIADVCRNRLWMESSLLSAGHTVKVRSGVRRRTDQVKAVVEFLLLLAIRPGAVSEIPPAQRVKAVEASLRAPYTCKAVRWCALQVRSDSGRNHSETFRHT